MMLSKRHLILTLAALLLFQWGGSVAVAETVNTKIKNVNDKLIVLTYHDIVTNTDDDDFSTSRAAFESHMEYLQSHGYRPVSLELVDKVYKKQASFPPKAVLLTFDDGLKSYANFVVPVLKTYHFPSVLSVVTSWVDGKDLPPEYVGKLLNWDDLRKLKKSPLISIVSHTHDLHHYVTSDPQGNTEPAATTRIYTPESGQYETEAQFRLRIATDLKFSVQRFQKELGFTPIAITWPYGHYDGVLMDEAESLGMTLQLTLDEGPATTKTLPRVNRIMLGDYGIEDFVSELNFQRVKEEKDYFAEIRLDPFVGLPDEAQNDLLSTLLDNLEKLKVTAVIIHPFDKKKQKAFFHNDKIPLATDMLNRVAYQISSRLDVRHVYLAMPDGNPDLLQPDVIKDMSRLDWFDGVIFKNQNQDQIASIKKITAYYHPAIRFGRFTTVAGKQKNNESKFDFKVLTLNAGLDKAALRQQLLASKKLPGKVLVSMSLPQHGKHNFEDMFGMLMSLGIRNYGFAYDRRVYGLGENSVGAHERAVDAVAVFGG